MRIRSKIKAIQVRFYDLIKVTSLASFLRSRSYSQFWEDRLILRMLNSNIGSYVDIGAGAPSWGSNTYLLYKRGWRGVCVDPIKFNIDLHKIIRRHDRQYKSVVSSGSSQIQFYELSPWELSTTDESIAQLRIREGARHIQSGLLNSISLEKIYEENPIKRPALLSIDVEGAEMSVLQSNNWSRYSPDIICIEELNNPLSDSEIKSFLSKVGYQMAAYNGVSSIYIWTKSDQLINSLT
ncbi:FkbM family methyltransferase [Candidatus Planktophila lacus]|uniref:Methyltransferase n=1 Tax=Candidatus Planktophila lacus TaxID=1884913 RepID=A0AAD0E4U5_9ACTN|nr:FkbM family methyltransferase [Candidatus Planktophila lacus]ASY10865.1 methyltransferase [Candidatus Planktophila lacus]